MRWIEAAGVLILLIIVSGLAVLFVGTQVSGILKTGSGAIVLVNSVPSFGYWDVPAGATPVPTPDASAAALGVPLVVEAVDIPLDHTGVYDVPVGEAVLPNGYLSEFAMTIANGEDGTFLTRSPGIWLEFRPSPDASPFSWNGYHQGLVDGPQRVFVTVHFDLEQFDPGAVMQVRDIVTR